MLLDSLSVLQVTAVASQVALVVKDPSSNAGDARDPDWIPGSGRCPGEGNGYPLHLAWTVPWAEEYVFVE